MTDTVAREGASISLYNRIARELNPARLASNIIAGLVVSVMVVIVAVSLATLIFSGELESYLSEGIGLMMFSGVVVTAVVAFTSSYPGMIAYPQERVAPILAIIAAYIVHELSGKLPPQEIFYTVIAAITLASLACGLFLLTLGVFRLGSLIRFIPYPVIGGFLAGTGWLLVRGSLGVMLGFQVHIGELPLLAESGNLPKWILGVTFGFSLVLFTRWFKQSLVLPGLMVGSIVMFYLTTQSVGISVADARAGGWLLGPFPPSKAWHPIAYTAALHADWPVILSQAGHLATILLIAVISVLLSSGAMELLVERDIDLNRELRVSGLANLLIGLGGGTVGFHTLSMSRLAHRMGGESRLVGIIASIACLSMLVLGADIMTYLPRFMLGGLLFFLGMCFLIEWVWDASLRLTRTDYLVVVLILAFVAIFGYLHGVVVGVFTCVILFLINYSQVDVVKHALSGSDVQSNVDRPARHHRILRKNGGHVFLFKLQGFIFFGTATGLLNQVRQRVEINGRNSLKFMLLDFRHVTGFDSSSVLSFVKMRQLAAKKGFTLIFTDISKAMQHQLTKEGFFKVPPSVFRTFKDLDHGLEWCEDHLLAEEKITAEQYDEITLHDQFLEDFPDSVDVDRLLAYFRREEVDKGTQLICEGEESDDLFLIEKGQVTAFLGINGNKTVRLRTMYAGTIVGELGLILNEPRSATVVADKPTVIYRLSSGAMKRMNVENPSIALAFNNFLTRLVAERLINTSKTIQTILE